MKVNKEKNAVDFAINVTVESGILTLRTIDALFKKLAGGEK